LKLLSNAGHGVLWRVVDEQVYVFGCAVHFNPEQPDAHYRLGRVCQATGNQAASRKESRKSENSMRKPSRTCHAKCLQLRLRCHSSASETEPFVKALVSAH
jgi:hypothetical protein